MNLEENSKIIPDQKEIKQALKGIAKQINSRRES